MNTFYLKIASICFAVHVPPEAPLSHLLETYHHYLLSDVDAQTPLWHVHLSYDPALSEPVESWITHNETLTRFQMHEYTGWLDFAEKQSRISAFSSQNEATRSAVERMMVYICMQEFPRHHDALIIHGAGIVINGAGMGFFGASGRGKSTVSRLAAGIGEVLSDENFIIQRTPEGPKLLGTPFWGTNTPAERVRAAQPQIVPLKALYALHHAPTFRLDTLSPAQATMELLSSEKVATERVTSANAWLAMVARIVAEVPIYRLGFLPTRELWTFLANEKI